MKRIIVAAVLMLTLLFSLSSCGKSGNTAKNGQKTNENQNQAVGSDNINNKAGGKNDVNQKVKGQAGNAINAAEEIQNILNGLTDDFAEVQANEPDNTSIDKSAQELNEILSNDSDNVDFNN